MAEVGLSGRTAFASNKALSINLQMTANPSPDKSLRCSVAPTKIRLSLEPPPPSVREVLTFWFVMQGEDPVRLELHRLLDGSQMVKYGDNPLSGTWSWRVPLRMSIESEFKCHFVMPGFEDGRWFYFEQIGKSPMYRDDTLDPQYNVFLIFLPEESW